MTHDIIVDGVNKNNPFKCNSMKWVRSIDNFSDSCTIKIPAITFLKKEGDSYERVQTGLQFKEGMKVQVLAGYDRNNELRFKGYIRRINYSIPLELECEGYSYGLRKKLNFSKSYKDTTVKKILTDLIEGTEIVLSKNIPNIPIEKATFINVTGIQVLEWLKEKCLLTVYFNFNELYAGMQQLEPKVTKKFRLGWNVIKDSELKFNDRKEFAEVRIKLNSTTKTGKKNNTFVGKKDGQVLTLKTAIKNETVKKEIAERERQRIINRGYEGMITGFLHPYVEPGMAASIEDVKYPERTGKYFIDSVEGEFGPNGGRQKIKLGNTLGNG